MSIKNVNSSGAHSIEDYETLRTIYDRWIRVLARKLAVSDYDLAEDLEQEGHIALWKASRSSPVYNASNTIGYIRSCIRFRMFRFLKREQLVKMGTI